MRFIVDAQLPPGLCRWLRERGHSAIHVSEISTMALPDEMIARIAEFQKDILISKDDDFVRLRQPDRFVLLWLRCGNISNRGLRASLEDRWEDVERRLAEGEALIELH